MKFSGSILCVCVGFVFLVKQLHSQPAQNDKEPADEVSKEIFPISAPQEPEAEDNSSTPNLPIITTPFSLKDFSSEIQELIGQKQDIVQTLLQYYEDSFSNRDQLIYDCSCVPNRCDNQYVSGTTCNQGLGTPAQCDGYSTGSMYSLDMGAVGMPQPDVYPDQLPGGLKATNCLLKNMEKAVPMLKELQTTTWAYVGTELGAIWVYPGRLAERSAEDGLEQWNYCLPYDTRRRQWYHEGATGPLDMVLVVDVSGSMTDVVANGKTRWQIVSDALIQFVDTLTQMDYFNIVFFNYQYQSMVDGLLQGTQQNRDMAKDYIRSKSPSGGTNFEVAFEGAFDSLIHGAEAEKTSNCNSVILFMTDGKDNDLSDKDRTEEILNLIEEKQQKLFLRANIFTYSIGEEANDAVPRQIACMHNGTWTAIGATDDPLTAFNSFVKFVASGRNQTRFYWSEVYIDSFGLGEMISITLPVFTPRISEEVPGVLFGVVSHDLLTEEIRSLAGSQTDRLIDILHQDSKICDVFQANSCVQQVLRGQDTQCPDRQYATAKCVRFNGKYYIKSTQMKDYEESKEACQSAGGQLAVPNYQEELSFLAGAAAFAGSWIGLKENGNQWVWEESSTLQDNDNLWGYGQGDLGQNNCAAIAPTGAAMNLYSHRCHEDFTYICEFTDLPDTCGGQYVDVDGSEYETWMPSIERCTSTESLDSLVWFENVDPEVSAENLFCGDFSQTQLCSNQSLMCCSEEANTSDDQEQVFELQCEVLEVNNNSMPSMQANYILAFFICIFLLLITI
eukprot:TRINITY_DN4469_c0_g2_i1.p1 TRINITY_DN4469_c0_g2~~TRINITY_DN4469_c0_g2_i1.p1  ORF type:complete len:786 (-),score=91.23 TRINITY_DN4469_c0_g2_i1:205-2562(-)